MTYKTKYMLFIYVATVFIFAAVVAGTNKSISAMSENAELFERKCVVIDAGHGGEDGGATSCGGILESSLNLEISTRLNDLLHLLGTKTLMIRTTDCALHTRGNTIAERKISDLKERVRIINDTQNAVLISIHQNTFVDGKYSGAQVFYSEKGEGKQFAEIIQGSLIKTINPGSNRNIKLAKEIYLMEHIDCTGVLVECGFISNPAEEALLRSSDYQQKLSAVLATSVSRFLYS